MKLLESQQSPKGRWYRTCMQNRALTLKNATLNPVVGIHMLRQPNSDQRLLGVGHVWDSGPNGAVPLIGCKQLGVLRSHGK